MILFLLVLVLIPSYASATPGVQAASTTPEISYVAGSSQKVCQLTGETDRQFNKPTASQTETRYGLVGNDLGYSFEHNGKLFFLFGDSDPTSTFSGKPNKENDPPRPGSDGNDAIGYVPNIASITSLDQCLRLDFTVDQIGAYENPVVLNEQGQPAITLGVNEVPGSGISDSGRMFGFFRTDNYAHLDGKSPEKGDLGQSTRTVVGVSDDDANTWHYLYDFSKPSTSGTSDAKFIYSTAIVQSPDGYLYIWGTQGWTQYRHSPAFLARKPVGSMSTLNPIEYLRSLNPDGTPVWGSSENDAAPLFHDSPDCAGDVGVEWNQFVNRWVMLYDCLTSNTPSNPHGIWMRTAMQPWGPWSPPQTIFNKDDGLCKFIHRAVNAQNPTACDNLTTHDRIGVEGSTYSPYLISRYTTGEQIHGTSTFYYVMSTWNPYTQVIMKTTIQGSATASSTSKSTNTQSSPSILLHTTEFIGDASRCYLLSQPHMNAIVVISTPFFSIAIQFEALSILKK